MILSSLDQTKGCLCLAARRAARAITREFDRALRPHGLRSTQFSALAVLALSGPKTIGELAGILSADRTTMSRNLGLLRERALLELCPGSDARERIASLTARGRKTLESALADWQRTQACITESMGEDAADRLRTIAWSETGSGPTGVTP